MPQGSVHLFANLCIIYLSLTGKKNRNPLSALSRVKLIVWTISNIHLSSVHFTLFCINHSPEKHLIHHENSKKPTSDQDFLLIFSLCKHIYLFATQFLAKLTLRLMQMAGEANRKMLCKLLWQVWEWGGCLDPSYINIFPEINKVFAQWVGICRAINFNWLMNMEGNLYSHAKFLAPTRA